MSRDNHDLARLDREDAVEYREKVLYKPVHEGCLDKKRNRNVLYSTNTDMYLELA